MNDQRRLRSNATALTTEQKKKLAIDAGITDNMDQNIAEEKMKKAIEDKIKKEILNNPSNQKRISLKFTDEDHNKDLVQPKYLDLKKEYTTKGEKVKLNIFIKKTILFHDKGKIVCNFDKKNTDDIEPYTQIINFNNFLYQFDENEVGKLEIQDLLDTEYEQLEDLKEKCKEFYDYSKLITDLKKKTEKNPEEEHLLLFFTKKIEELALNENNIQIFMNNIDKVESISYNNSGTKVYFSK